MYTCAQLFLHKKITPTQSLHTAAMRPPKCEGRIRMA